MTESLLEPAAAPADPDPAPAGAPEPWSLDIPEALGGPVPEIDERLRAAGFTAAQAELVYALAADYVLPMLDGADGEVAAERESERLAQAFGGETRWRETAGQLLAWGRANLKPDVLAALSTTYEGVMALKSMMTSNEPGLAHAAPAQAEDEAAIRARMRDPRYWRDRDPQALAQVESAFRRLYGEG